MTPIDPIAATHNAGMAAPAAPLLQTPLMGGPLGTGVLGQVNFGALLMGGVGQVEAKIKTADNLVRRFALDDSIPVHQVTIALEEARLAVELAVQIRNKVVESYREIMNMQL